MSPRTSIVTVGLLLAVHGAVLTIFGPHGRGPVLSSAVQLVMGLVCIGAALQAARGASSAFERRFLLLVAARFVIWAMAQGLCVWYEMQGNEQFSGSLADVLFHLENVPLGIALFLDPGSTQDRLRRTDAIDLGQLIVFWSAVYLYIRYMTTGSAAGVGLLATTHALVAGSFYLRAMTSRSAMASGLFGRWTPATLLATVNPAYSGSYDSLAGSPFDLIWSLELLVWVLTAATWRPARAEAGLDGARPIDRTVHLLPLVVGCFTLVLSLGFAPHKPLLAGLLVAASFGLAGVQLHGQRLLRRSQPRARSGWR